MARFENIEGGGGGWCRGAAGNLNKTYQWDALAYPGEEVIVCDAKNKETGLCRDGNVPCRWSNTVKRNWSDFMQEEDPVLRFDTAAGLFIVDTSTLVAVSPFRDEPTQLTKSHVNILTDLGQHQGRVRSREQLYVASQTKATGEHALRVVDVHVKNLRQRIGQPLDTETPVVKTVLNKGYSMTLPLGIHH